MPDRLWHPALDQDGTLRAGAEVAELTRMVNLDGYPAGTRTIVRRERPHPGAQLILSTPPTTPVAHLVRHSPWVTGAEGTRHEAGESGAFEDAFAMASGKF